MVIRAVARLLMVGAKRGFPPTIFVFNLSKKINKIRFLLIMNC